jgi:hypothetical protein
MYALIPMPFIIGIDAMIGLRLMLTYGTALTDNGVGTDSIASITKPNIPHLTDMNEAQPYDPQTDDKLDDIEEAIYVMDATH